MIDKFCSKNYKAFDYFDLELKPISILLGANSCGKSAIINSILLLSQTCESTHTFDSVLRLNGKRIVMGEALNILKNKDKNNKMSFSIEVNNTKNIEVLIDELKKELIMSHYEIARIVSRIYENNVKLDKISKENFKKHKNFIRKMQIFYFRDSILKEENLVKLNNFLKLAINICHNNIDKFKNKDKVIYNEILSHLNDMSTSKINYFLTKIINISSKNLSAKKISYQYEYKNSKKKLEIKKIELFNSKNELIICIDNKKNKTTLFSELIENKVLHSSKKEFYNQINLNNFHIVKDIDTNIFHPSTFIKKTNNYISLYLTMIIKYSIDNLISSFVDNAVNHVTPLRAFPQRYYLLDKSIHHEQLDSSNGTELAEVLKNNPTILDKINDLFLEFNIEIRIIKVNDIIHKIVVNQNSSIDLELTDVGFGISQALPILVQCFLSPKNSLTIIEQPEIHLHPRMQAWLIDALINIALDDKKRFLIETHSETIIRRIRLRIVDKENRLTLDDTAIYHVERNGQNTSSELKKISINSNGDISYPKDFMDVEINDTLAIQSMKLEKMKKCKEI
ncbi:AAA family ATPase [Arsenophonus sp. aPb]|uniref:AAA family ATPase n=1 Tax=Arsenophonus sp. aPb TaxID=3041619 RepID=UPI002468DBCD|nr:AAA family ATPase [Arsenophonus sp. aPb]WGL98628.1 AAA family ATPase [Arsenophonus sp. aPb]